MTLEELLDFDIDRLEALTDNELEVLTKPYWPTTRPELINSEKAAKRPAKVKIVSSDDRQKEMDMDKALAIAKSFGINLRK